MIPVKRFEGNCCVKSINFIHPFHTYRCINQLRCNYKSCSSFKLLYKVRLEHLLQFFKNKSIKNILEKNSKDIQAF